MVSVHPRLVSKKDIGVSDFLPEFVEANVISQPHNLIKIENVSCEYDRLMVETQLCALRDTSDTLIGRACVIFHL